MEHEIGIGDLVVAADKPAGFEMVRGPGSGAAEEPARADQRPVPPPEGGSHRDRLPAGVLDIDLEMVLEVLSYTGKTRDDADAESLEERGLAHAGELQQLRRVDGPTAQDHVASPHDPSASAAPAVLDADRPGPLEQDPRHEGSALDRE